MTDEDFMELMEDEGVDEACRRVIVEAWHEVQKELMKESQKNLN